MNRIILCIFLCLAGFNQLRAQQKFTFSGYVRDTLSGENLIGATVAINGQGKGVNSNAYGFFSITLPEGNYKVTISFTGYESQIASIELNRDISLNINLAPRIVASEEVIVYDNRKDGYVRDSQMGNVDLSICQIKSIPAIFG